MGARHSVVVAVAFMTRLWENFAVECPLACQRLLLRWRFIDDHLLATHLQSCGLSEVIDTFNAWSTRSGWCVQLEITGALAFSKPLVFLDVALFWSSDLLLTVVADKPLDAHAYVHLIPPTPTMSPRRS